MKQILTLTKQAVQIFFKTGKYYKRHKSFKDYTDQISVLNELVKDDYLLLDEFAVFCRKKFMLEEGIHFLDKRCNVSNGKSLAILNFFRVQLYIRLHKSEPFKVSSAKIKQLVDSVLLSSFGPDFNQQIFRNTEYNNKIDSSELRIMDAGWENIGFLSHSSLDKNFHALTKIGTAYQLSNEPLFYAQISNKYPDLIDKVPHFIDYRLGRFGVVNLLTMQRVGGKPCGVSDFDNLINLHFETLQKCPFDIELQEILKQPFLINYNHIHLSKSYGRIHEEIHFHQILDWIDLALSEKPYDKMIISNIKDLTNIMKSREFYKCIIPEQHYTLCHGDYSLNNVLYDEELNQYHIIDWTQCNFGPKMMDISTILRKQREYTYSYVELEEILSNMKKQYAISGIDEFLFYFGSILVSLMLKRGTIIEEDPSIFFMPAINKCISLLEKDI